MLWDAHVRGTLVIKLCAVPFLRLLTKGLVFRCGQVRHAGLLHLNTSVGFLGEGGVLGGELDLWLYYGTGTYMLLLVFVEDWSLYPPIKISTTPKRVKPCNHPHCFTCPKPLSYKVIHSITTHQPFHLTYTFTCKCTGLIYCIICFKCFKYM